jgi:hypothetical protein
LLIDLTGDSNWKKEMEINVNVFLKIVSLGVIRGFFKMEVNTGVFELLTLRQKQLF